GREALRRAHKRTEGLRHGAGEEDVRPGERCVEVVRKPLLGCRLLALGAVPVATGRLDAVVSLTVWALREARAVMAAAAGLDGTDDRAVGGGEGGRALQQCWRKGGKDRAEG